MFFGKKSNQNALPDLPSTRMPKRFEVSSNENSEDDEEMGDQSLPAFPDSPAHNKFSQAAIKDAVSSSEDSSSYMMREIPLKDEDMKHTQVTELEEWTPNEPKSSLYEHENDSETLSLPEPVSMKQPIIKEPKSADVFVKIDKFYSARRSLSEIKTKLDEVNEFIKKIRETKLREEQELVSWEKDMLHIKSRIKNVTESIFEKVE